MMIRTQRLEIIAGTLAHVVAEIEEPRELGRLLGAEIPASWPPGEHDRDAMEFFRGRLTEDSGAVGWYCWYAVHRSTGGSADIVVGTGGYHGPPDADGVVEVGYSIAPEFHGRAFATELVEALVARAFSVQGVNRVIAHTDATNAASLKVLEKCGFTPRTNDPRGELEKCRSGPKP